jgi:subtilisin family serine protease
MRAPRKPLLGTNFRKIAPKLRLIANGSAAVNAVRAEGCAAVAIDARRVALKRIDLMRGPGAIPVQRSALPKSVKRGRLRSLANEVLVDVFVETSGTPTSLRASEITARAGTLVTATIPLNRLPRIANDRNVAHVEPAQGLSTPQPTVEAEHVGPPPQNSRRIGDARKHRNGKDRVLIGIIDVQGFDFAHPDFLDGNGGTRFVSIWDQGGSTRPSPSNAPPCNYGAELKQRDLNRAIRAAPARGVPAVELEPQSEMVPGSHATHVASIAAGNRGVCPEAYLAGVLVSLPKEDLDPRRSFYDSTRIMHAIEYLLGVARFLGVPLSINVSLGTNGHAHDGSAAVNRWIESVLAVPGKAVSVAAGNAGQEAPQSEQDLGYIMGRIHTGGRIAARGLDQDIEWVVVGNGIADISENELEIWYSPQDRFAISVRPPGMGWIGPVEPGEFIENRQLSDGTFVSIYNELYNPANGANYIAVYLSPFFSNVGVVGVTGGVWTVRLHGREIRDGRFHGWIERDDPRPWGKTGQKEAWSFPSFFSERSSVDESSVSSLGCGSSVVTVANLDQARERINVTSSQGPTRDGKLKPDIAAPGTDIVAAKGFSGSSDLWISMSGTSMASPFVAGVIGLMLSVEPKLTASQIVGILQRMAKPLPGADFRWRNDSGFGVVDPEGCVLEAERVNKRVDRT